MTDSQNQKDKVFFITSNQSTLDKFIKYSLSEAEGMSNFNLILNTPQKHENEEFLSKVFYFEIIPERINRYEAKIILNYNKTDFEGIILFKRDKKNYFIYNFKFKEHKNLFFGKTPPPKYINFTTLDQLKLFNKALKVLNAKQGDPLFINLIDDSKCYITGQNFMLDFY